MFRTSFRRVGSRKGRYAFTLVELLVVVAILALLISILLPTLNKAKEQAISVVCKTNLKSIALATQLYTHSYNGWVHGACGTYYNHGSSVWSGGGTWCQKMRELDLLPELDDPNTQALSFCPSRVTPKSTFGGEDYVYSYGQRMAINDYVYPDESGWWERWRGFFNMTGPQVRCRRGGGSDNDYHYPYVPSDFVLHADTLALSSPYDYNSGREQCYAFKDSTTNATPTGYNFIEMRHAGKANCAFADSHVEGLNRDELSNLGFRDREDGSGNVDYVYLWPLAP